MHDILVILIHSIVTVVRLMKPGGLRAVVAESALTRHQILILNRSRKRAPNLRASDRLIAGFCTLLMHPSRLLRCAIVLKPSTLLHFHRVLTNRKYHIMFSSKRGGRPGPKGVWSKYSNVLKSWVMSLRAETAVGKRYASNLDRVTLRYVRFGMLSLDSAFSPQP
jgi:hypothetical protein